MRINSTRGMFLLFKISVEEVVASSPPPWILGKTSKNGIHFRKLITFTLNILMVMNKHI